MNRIGLFLIIGGMLIACSEEKDRRASGKDAYSESDVASRNMEQALFELVSPVASGLDFNNKLEEKPEHNYISYEFYYNGGGVAAGDVNGDGMVDLYFTGNLVPDRLYLNRGGMKFEDVTQASGILTGNSWHTGVNMVDINADGHLDIYVCRSGWFTDPGKLSNLLYINKGDGTFTEQAAAYGLDDAGHGIQSAFFDADGDNDLDMYLLNHPDPDNMPPSTDLAGYLEGIGTGQYTVDRFFRNEGGKYVDRTQAAGFQNFGYRHGIAVADYNMDGYLDLYLSNDFDDPDHLYINQGDGTFRNVINEAMNHISMFSMGNDVADINRDGWLDIFVADMTPSEHKRSKQNMASMNPQKFYGMTEHGYHWQYMLNTLQLNNGDGTFSEIGGLAGVATTDWSWATLFGDFDLDGWPDLFVANGINRDIFNNDVRLKVAELQSRGEQLTAMKVLQLMPQTKLKNNFFRNRGDLTFENTTDSWLDNPELNSNGAVWADLDGDGDLDLVTNNINDPAAIYENRASDRKLGDYLKVKLRGPGGNTAGLGAKLILEGNDFRQIQEMQTCRGYYSSVEPVAHFGFPSGTSPTRLQLIWTDGTVQETALDGRSKIIEVAYEPQAEYEYDTPAPGMFVPVENRRGLDFVHRENEFNDFQKEILLPHRQSIEGPAMAAADVNGDGLKDLYIGGAAGQSAALYFQQSGGHFRKAGSTPFAMHAASEDIGVLFFDADGDGDSDLYVASGAYSASRGAEELQDRLYINNGKGGFSYDKQRLPKIAESTKAVIAFDYDGDGDLDLFVGGRVIPQTYPLVPRSYLLENKEGRFVDVTEDFPELKKPGLVTAAAAGDLNADGRPDLVVTGEWMPVRIFYNSGSKFHERSDLQNVNGHTGWFWELQIADLNGDGKQDIIAGNLGLNNKFHPSHEKPLKVYTNDFDGNGTLDIVLSKKSSGGFVPVRGRECSSEQMPLIQQKFPTYKDFAEASLEEIYGADKLEEADFKQATSFATIWLENKGEAGFEIHPLPMRAQIAPARSILTGDWNGDGHTDILVAGNHFGAEVETVRYDAGTGVLLLGDGNGGFSALSPADSGLSLKQDVRKVVYLEESSLLIAAVNDGAPVVYSMASGQ